MPKIALEILIDDRRWRRMPYLPRQLQTAADATFLHLPEFFRRPCLVTVYLTGNAAIRQLNRDFRGKNRPTNILSFPQIAPFELTKKSKKTEEIHAGDLVLAYQYIAEEARKTHKTLLNHVSHLLIHGVLHLFGYDHVSGAGAIQMERLETRIMRKLGLPDPYAPQPRESKAHSHAL